MIAEAANPYDRLYVVSCRKRHPHNPEGRESRLIPEVLTVPKRAGTFMLFHGPRKPDIRESDLVADLQSDTDPGERHHLQRIANENWRDWQRLNEDAIAQRLWALGDIVLYVHGFNTKPGEALSTAVRLQQTLDSYGVKKTVVVFTWPSAGHILDYFPDQKAAGRFGSYALVNLLRALRRTAPAGKVPDCVAHSMGTYVVTRALGTISTLRLDDQFPGPMLEQVAYMQPDIDYDILCSGYTGPAYDSPSYLEIPDGYGATMLVRRLTIYCSTNDVALFASLFKNRTKRLGAYGPGLESTTDRTVVMNTRLRPNVFVVNVDDGCVLDPSPRHSHSHFIECPVMLADLVSVLVDQPTPGRAATGVPRWGRLNYPMRLPSPGTQLLRTMATFWRTVGSLVLNPVVVWLVKGKKLLQRAFQILGWIVPAFSAITGAIAVGGLATVVHTQSASVAAGVALVIVLALYILVWIRARSIQKAEDRVSRSSLAASSGVGAHAQ